MRNLILCAIAAGIAFLTGTSLRAQDISGVWQGILHNGATGVDRRLVLHIAKSETGGWSGAFYTIDLSGDPIPLASVTLHASDFEYSFGPDAHYSGILSADGNSIKGTSFGSAVLPLDFQRATKETLWRFPPSHAILSVTVDKDVKLEVLDWGGSGPPLIFLAGAGNTAHIFDAFAPKFIAAHHVYGITRRGFGNSSAPAPADGNYSADRLADDVLAVMDSLKLNRPVLAGHSIAGEELSSIGSRHPEEVAGLVYLDAGYWYAYYNPSRGNVTLDSINVRKKLEMVPTLGPPDAVKSIQELLRTDLPRLEKELADYEQVLKGFAPQYQVSLKPEDVPPAIPAILAGEQKYSQITVPILAIFAISDNSPFRQTSVDSADDFERGVPSARVVRLQNANHYVFQSNEADVLREMNAFLATLK
jgi:non-heme chloroperoxidase